jgi:hypothetical protein
MDHTGKLARNREKPAWPLMGGSNGIAESHEFAAARRNLRLFFGFIYV